MDWEVREPCGSAFVCRLHIELPSIPDYTRCSSPGFVDDCLNRDIEVRLNLDPRRAAEGRRVLKWAPTRGAPTGGYGFGHSQGVPLRGDSAGWRVGGYGLGHPQGVPLRGGFGWLARFGGYGLGHPQGVPLRGDSARLARFGGTGLGTHKGCPYGGMGRVGAFGVAGPGAHEGCHCGGMGQVGADWALPCLACLGWLTFGASHDVGGGAGRRGTTTSYCPHTRCGARL